MPYSFTLTTTIPASPQEVYEAWLDSLAHSEMTGGEAQMSDEIGADVTAWGNYISGRNVELVPGERIVQTWRTSEFDEEHEDSIITLTLEPVDEGTLLTLEHSNVPEEQKSYEEGGWQENYFEPMIAYFAERQQSAAAAPAKKARAKAAGKAAPKAPPRKAKSTGKVKRARPAKKRAAPRTKASTAKKRKIGRKAAAPKRRAAKSRRK